MTIRPIFNPNARMRDRSPLAAGRASRISGPLAFLLELRRDNNLPRTGLVVRGSLAAFSSDAAVSESDKLSALGEGAPEDVCKCPFGVESFATFTGGAGSSSSASTTTFFTGEGIVLSSTAARFEVSDSELAFALSGASLEATLSSL